MALIRMKAPKWLTSFSLGGILREIKNGFVHVEEEHVEQAQAHGLTLEDDEGKPAAPAPAAGASIGETTPAASTAPAASSESKPAA